MSRLIIQVSCPDQPGVVAQVAWLIHNAGGNILDEGSHRESNPDWFFMRVEVDLSEAKSTRQGLETALSDVMQEQFGGQVQTWDPDVLQRVAILVGNEETCALDLLVRQRFGRLKCKIPLVISNYDNLELFIQQGFQAAFAQVRSKDRAEREEVMLELLEQHRIDLVVLARYMKVLSPEFVARYEGRIINIHHSSLPAFAGDQEAYQQAWKRGVKVIGATAHYVIAELDEGPIIAQDVVTVDHQDSVMAMEDKGREVERRVLATAVIAHLEHRIMVHGDRTIVSR